MFATGICIVAAGVSVNLTNTAARFGFPLPGSLLKPAEVRFRLGAALTKLFFAVCVGVRAQVVKISVGSGLGSGSKVKEAKTSSPEGLLIASKV